MHHLFIRVRSAIFSQNFDRRLFAMATLLAGLLGLGTVGYVVLEGWTARDALFMTVITLSTVGYSTVEPLSPRGEVFSIFLIILGVGGAAYTFSTFTNYIVAGELRGALRRRQMRNKISQLKDHYIVCGYGRVGKQVVAGLREHDCAVVVIDNDPEHVTELEASNLTYIIGNATEDHILEEAGIHEARGLSSCLPQDANNVFAVLSARALNPKLTIISRSNLTESAPKLRIAGADQIINPYLITGRRMAAELTSPTLVEFLDVVMQRGELQLRIEDINIDGGSNMVGRTLAECNVRKETGANVLAVRRGNGKVLTDLGGDVLLNAGDTLIALGTLRQLSSLAKDAGDIHKRLI